MLGIGPKQVKVGWQPRIISADTQIFRIGSLDLGQSQDPAALSVIEQTRHGSDFIGPCDPRWRLVRLRPWELNTDYGQIISDCLAMKTLNFFLIDATGAKPFVDWFRREALNKNWQTRIVPINITTSAMREAAQREHGYWSVPKAEIVNSLIVMEHKGFLALDREARIVKQLFKQLGTFQMRITKSAHQTFGARGGHHDDLVMSLGMACWWALRAARSSALVAC